MWQKLLFTFHTCHTSLLPPHTSRSQCYRCISVYMAFSVSNIFFLITGLLVVLLLQKMDLHVDLISLCFILYNFAVRFIEPHAAGRAEQVAVTLLCVARSQGRVTACNAVPLVLWE